MNATIHRVEQARNGIAVRTTNNQYCFPYLKGDNIRGGTKADIEGTVTYGGDSLSKHYITSHDLSEVPNAVLEAVAEHATILDNVDGGWARWDGRPEFSTSYVDISDATVVETDE
jgi:hypothetical protein